MPTVERGTFESVADDLANALMMTLETVGCIGTPGHAAAHRQLSVALERAIVAIIIGGQITDEPKMKKWRGGVAYDWIGADGVRDRSFTSMYVEAPDAETAQSLITNKLPRNSLTERWTIMSIEEVSDAEGDQDFSAGRLAEGHSGVVSADSVDRILPDADVHVLPPARGNEGSPGESGAESGIRGERVGETRQADGSGSAAERDVTDVPESDVTDTECPPLALKIDVFVRNGVTIDELRDGAVGRQIYFNGMTDAGPIVFSAQITSIDPLGQ